MEYNGNPESVGYKIKYSRADGHGKTLSHVVQDRVEREYTIEDLEEWTEYRVQVQAFNTIGSGPWSQMVMGRTRESGTAPSGQPPHPLHLPGAWGYPPTLSLHPQGLLRAQGLELLCENVLGLFSYLCSASSRAPCVCVCGRAFQDLTFPALLPKVPRRGFPPLRPHFFFFGRVGSSFLCKGFL